MAVRHRQLGVIEAPRLVQIVALHPDSDGNQELIAVDSDGEVWTRAWADETCSYLWMPAGWPFVTVVGA